MLGCHYEDPVTRTVTFYEARVMVLGESGAVRCFSKLLRPVLTEARIRGWRGIGYVDDFNHLGRSWEECNKNRQIFKEVATEAGWKFSASKEQEASQNFKMLGFVVDTVRMLFKVPENKILKAEKAMQFIISAKAGNRKVTARNLAKVTGLLSSFSRAYPGFSRLCLRSCYHAIEARPGGWDWYIPVPQLVRDELAWWRENLRTLNGGGIRRLEGFEVTEIKEKLYGDASEQGIYLYQINPPKTLVSQPLKQDEKLKSSTFRELKVFQNFYCSDQAEVFRNKKVLHYTDSQAVFYIVRFGSRKVELQEQAKKVFLACKEKNIELIVDWKRRSEPEMVIADIGSRGPWRAKDEFSLDEDLIQWIKHKYKPDVDCFANGRNNLVNTFYSLGRDEEAKGEDFFKQDLSGGIHWVHPHPSQLLKALKYLFSKGANSAIMIHIWPAEATFPTLCPQGHLIRGLQEPVRVWPSFIQEEGQGECRAFRGTR